MPGPIIPSLLRADEPKRKATHTAPKRHERHVAEGLGGWKTPASGAMAGAKGDVRGVRAWVFEFLVECKTTVGKRLLLQAEWLAKITSEAGPMRVPAVAIRFNPEVISEYARKYGAETEADWIMIPMSFFQKIQGALDGEGEK